MRKVKDVSTINSVNVGSDRRLERGKVQISTKKERSKSLPISANVNQENLISMSKFQKQVKKIYLKSYQLNKQQMMETSMIRMRKNQDNKGSSTRNCREKTKNNNSELPSEIRDLLEKKRNMKRNTNISRIEYTELCKKNKKKDEGTNSIQKKRL